MHWFKIDKRTCWFEIDNWTAIEHAGSQANIDKRTRSFCPKIVGITLFLEQPLQNLQIHTATKSPFLSLLTSKRASNHPLKQHTNHTVEATHARTWRHYPNMGYYLHPNMVKKGSLTLRWDFSSVLTHGSMICQLDGRPSGVGRLVGNNWITLNNFFVHNMFNHAITNLQLTDWLSVCLSVWLIDWLTDSLTHWPTDPLTHWLTDSLTDDLTENNNGKIVIVSVNFTVCVCRNVFRLNLRISQ